ncbi:MAG: hypothetical protein E8A46_00150 [Bradyrhizobium sp.]|uniref:hypothetical protein n=1 Tax=Bradyrhizobium sp. TaxID=376 RepID=UPI0011F4A5E0|nr:hypothetical protein [Bradyrhizobium sp.]THD58344.1 MAG: hypothetical protein E8A46_00150 [Bradyrhizobium sp.]
MSRWFRLYDDVINDPKILMLPEGLRWIWIAMLCIASKNNGTLPSTDVVAVSLRIKRPKAAEYITKLVAAGLIDNDGGKFSPHNWNGRQYKSDVSTERVKRFRETRRNVSPNVSETAPESDSETDQSNDDEDARTRGPLLGQTAQDLAEQLLMIAGHDPRAWPPGWCGAAMRIQTWLSNGWHPEIIVMVSKAVMTRKHDGPPSTVQYFEKAIASVVAKQNAPLPKVEVSFQQIVKAKHNGTQRESLGQVAERFIQSGLTFGERPRGLRLEESESPVRLIPKG